MKWNPQDEDYLVGELRIVRDSQDPWILESQLMSLMPRLSQAQ